MAESPPRSASEARAEVTFGYVGQDEILRAVVNRANTSRRRLDKRVTNPLQVDNLPHTTARANSLETYDRRYASPTPPGIPRKVLPWYINSALAIGTEG
jgi:hypothetical protein